MRFIFGKSHPLASPAWFLKITTNEEFFQVHKWVSVREFLRFNKDPHNFDGEVKPENLIRHPVKLAGNWMQTGLKFFFEDGFVYVNCNGGFPRRLHDISAECDAEDWPGAEPILGEHCTVSTWGRHFYINSNKRIFTKEKFNYEGDAREYLMVYAPASIVAPGLIREIQPEP